MGLFDIFRGGDTVRGALDGASDLAGGLRDAITGEEHQRALAELQQQIQLAQSEANRQASQHASVFVAGARPFILWVCGFAIAYKFVVRPIIALWVDAPDVDAAALWPLLTGVLGLGGMRSWEKSKGVNDRHG